MIPKITLSAVSAATLLLAGSFVVPAANANTQTLAQAGSPAPLTREQNDARMTTCSRYRRAFHRLDTVKRELSQLQTDFTAADDIRPKLDALVTQTNDAQQTAQSRAEGADCASRH